MKLNPEQTQAVEHFDGPCIVTAVPGSGKTRTLTSRVVRLIERNVDPKNLLCLTFTNKAANEMKERVARTVGQSASQIWISTFHSFFLAILRKYGNLIGIPSNFSVYDDKDQTELIEKIGRMHEFATNRAGIQRIIKVANDCRENLQSLQDFGDLIDVEVAIISEYYDTLKTFNAVDFSGILFRTYELLKNHESVRQTLSNRFKYILGDEWQDTNTIQYESIKMLASHGNLFVVADRNQSIFSWRGAKPENLDRMKKDFSGVQEITLPRNYRSTARILKSAQNLIRKNEDARNVELISVKGDGHDVIVRNYINPEQESSIIARSIQEMKERFGYGWNSFAILYRTNILSKLPEMAMRHAGIPYRIYGGFSFFDRSEIKTSLAYLSFLANEHDTVAFSRAIQYPKRQIGPAVIGRLERVCQTEKISMLAACRRADYLSGIPQNGRKNLDEFITAVEKFRGLQSGGERLGRLAADFLQETGYYDYMKTESEKDEDFRRRVDNIDELLLSIADFEIQKPNAKLSDYLQSVELLTSDSKDKEEDAITLMTMHSAKGLEFPVVFVIGCEKDIVPHKSAILERGEDEERRLFYVAITRAQERLFLSHCQFRRSFSHKSKTNQQKPCSPSKFLFEINTSEIDTLDILDDEIAHL